MNQYTRSVEKIKAKPFHNLKDVKDQWRTEDDLYFGLEEVIQSVYLSDCRFVLDLFSDGQNAKSPEFYTAENNALKQPWADDLSSIGHPLGFAFGNPPYSINQKEDNGDLLTGMREIMKKTLEERENGARIGLLVKAATSESWWPCNKPDYSIFIRGRVSFDKPIWFCDEPGKPPVKLPAMFGCAFLIFDKECPAEKGPPLYLHQSQIRKLGKKKALAVMEERRRFIQQFEL